MNDEILSGNVNIEYLLKYHDTSVLKYLLHY